MSPAAARIKISKPRAAILLCLAGLARPCCAIAEPTHCFAENTRPSVPILQQAPPPITDDATGYRFFPASIFASMDLARLNATRSRIPQYFWQWANHGPRRVEKGNLGPHVNQASAAKLHFSSPAAADACTLAQTASVFGLAETARDYARRGSLKLVTLPEPARLTDVCVLWDATLPAHAEGILLDYEAQDGRTPGYTRDFLLDFAKLVHGAGRKAILHTNPLDAPTQALTGIGTSNAREIMNAFDRMTVLLWSGNRQQDILASFRSQIEVIGSPDPKKLILVFELRDTTLADAAIVRELAVKHGVFAVSLWRNHAEQGGECETSTNRKIACIAYGKCAL